MMKSELSSLLDGELEDERHQAVLSMLSDDAELRSTWSNYHRVGDALRHASRLDMDLTARVMAELQREPVVLAPRQNQIQDKKEPRGVLLRGTLLRYAAAVAGVGFVAWLSLSEPATRGVPTPGASSQALPTLAAEPASTSNVIQAQAQAQGHDRQRLQAYLVAHQAYSPGNRFDGGAGYVRTVVATR